MIPTRLTSYFNIKHPVLGAPMASAAGGDLAAAISRAGGLGFIGGGYCDVHWIDEQFVHAGNQRVGCGMITWALAENPEVLENVLDRDPAAIFLSFGDPSKFSHEIKHKGIPLICQVQSMRDARHAADIGADVIVAQGAEAGGHGQDRATFTLVPEIADWLANHFPATLLVAAGGIADGRGIAASLMLGADGVLVGSRFWASAEALVHPDMHTAALDASGDDTIRSKVMDVARNLDWPERYTCRVLANAFTDQWHHNLEGLLANASVAAENWLQAWERGDPDASNTFVGEVAGQLTDIRPAAEILEDMVEEAEELLSTDWVKSHESH